MTTHIPVTCPCGTTFYSPMTWVDGQRVPDETLCPECSGQGVLAI